MRSFLITCCTSLDNSPREKKAGGAGKKRWGLRRWASLLPEPRASARFRGLTFLRLDAPVRAAQVRRRTPGCGRRSLAGILVRRGTWFCLVRFITYCNHCLSAESTPFLSVLPERNAVEPQRKGRFGQGANRPLTTPVDAAFGKGRFCGRKRTGWVPENRCVAGYNTSD